MHDCASLQIELVSGCAISGIRDGRIDYQMLPEPARLFDIHQFCVHATAYRASRSTSVRRRTLSGVALSSLTHRLELSYPLP